ENFCFAWCKRFEASAQELYFRPFLAQRAIAFNRVLHGIQKVLPAHRFCQELHSALFHCAYRHGNVPVTGNEDSGNLHIRLLELAMKIETALSRHANVENQALWDIRDLRAQELGGRCKRLYAQAN